MDDGRQVGTKNIESKFKVGHSGSILVNQNNQDGAGLII